MDQFYELFEESGAESSQISSTTTKIFSFVPKMNESLTATGLERHEGE